MRLWLASPVFVSESVRAARRWQLFAARTAFLVALLASLLIAWVLRGPDHGVLPGGNALAAVGESFFIALTGTQLALVLLAAPAYLAGSVCLDRARGSLTHMLVTDLSAAEIVLGKLAARGLPVFGLLLTGLPVLALATLLGGIEPTAVLAGLVVACATAAVSCALALFLSVWGRRPHEVLLATYFVEGVWLLALPVWNWLAMAQPLGPPPDWLKVSNPFVLSFAPYAGPAVATVEHFAAFVAGCTGVGAVLVAGAVLTLRREPGYPKARRAAGWRRPTRRLGPTLDADPALWREFRRPTSGWLRVVWWLYLTLAAAASVVALVAGGGNQAAGMAAFVTAFQFSIGLVLTGVASVAAMFEDRVNGSLDVLLTTPLPTAAIVRAKWLAGFRPVLAASVLPLLLSGAVALLRERPGALATLAVLVGLMAAYGAFVNSLGLALAVWVPRFGVALGTAVAAITVLTAGPVLLLMAGGATSDQARALACVSPWYGVGETTFQLGGSGQTENLGAKAFLIFAYGAAAVVLAVVTVSTFDRCLGRSRDRRTTPRRARRARRL